MGTCNNNNQMTAAQCNECRQRQRSVSCPSYMTKSVGLGNVGCQGTPPNKQRYRCRLDPGRALTNIFNAATIRNFNTYCGGPGLYVMTKGSIIMQSNWNFTKHCTLLNWNHLEIIWKKILK